MYDNLLNKIIKVINSCKTMDQLRIADKYFKLAQCHLDENDINEIIICLDTKFSNLTKKI